MAIIQKKIVGAKIGTVITNRPSDIVWALDSGRNDIEFLEQERMQLMGALDLGRNWEAMARGPVLFILDWDTKKEMIVGIHEREEE